LIKVVKAALNIRKEFVQLGELVKLYCPRPVSVVDSAGPAQSGLAPLQKEAAPTLAKLLVVWLAPMILPYYVCDCG
jgi:hypothetical protein